jgi:hypothetical protein
MRVSNAVHSTAHELYYAQHRLDHNLKPGLSFEWTTKI